MIRAGIVVLGAVLGALPAVLHAADPRPHIVVILADDLGFADVGFHGGETKTPCLGGAEERQTAAAVPAREK